MPTNLTPEMRKRIAEACGYRAKVNGGECLVFTGISQRKQTMGEECWFPWEPSEGYSQKDDLVRTVAQRIEGVTAFNWREIYYKQFCKAIATNNVNALETLCAELISHE